jgi:hypothetical protein
MHIVNHATHGAVAVFSQSTCVAWSVVVGDEVIMHCNECFAELFWSTEEFRER